MIKSLINYCNTAVGVVPYAVAMTALVSQSATAGTTTIAKPNEYQIVNKQASVQWNYINSQFDVGNNDHVVLIARPRLEYGGQSLNVDWSCKWERYGYVWVASDKAVPGGWEFVLDSNHWPKGFHMIQTIKCTTTNLPAIKWVGFEDSTADIKIYDNSEVTYTLPSGSTTLPMPSEAYELSLGKYEQPWGYGGPGGKVLKVPTSEGTVTKRGMQVAVHYADVIDLDNSGGGGTRLLYTELPVGGVAYTLSYQALGGVKGKTVVRDTKGGQINEGGLYEYSGATEWVVAAEPHGALPVGVTKGEFVVTVEFR
ncbi:hypothetical protein QUQ76_004987 [Escherichia coli]|nr:hypothetical protein [Escherichia coli]